MLSTKKNKTERRDLQKFIKNELKQKIVKDLKKSRIFNEADLQSNVYLHLRKYLKNDNRWKIYNQPYITKMWGGKKTIKFYPDLVLAKTKPRISIELKEKIYIKKTQIIKDAKKLYKLRMQNVIRKGFVIYLYQNSKKNNEQEIQKEVNFWIKKYSPYVYCIMINAIQHIAKNKREQWVKQWKKARYRI